MKSMALLLLKLSKLREDTVPKMCACEFLVTGNVVAEFNEVIGDLAAEGESMAFVHADLREAESGVG
jgi:hypothetical protein